jgi:hypothetical protein
VYEWALKMYESLQKPGFYITHLHRGFPGSRWGQVIEESMKRGKKCRMNLEQSKVHAGNFNDLTEKLLENQN